MVSKRVIHFTLSEKSSFGLVSKITIWFVYKEKESKFLHLYIQAFIHASILLTHLLTRPHCTAHGRVQSSSHSGSFDTLIKVVHDPSEVEVIDVFV